MSFGIFDLIASAFSVYSAIEERAEDKRKARQERARAEQQAARKRDELDRLRSAQRVAFARAGVKLDGTPTLVIEEDQAKGLAEMEQVGANTLWRADAGAARATRNSVGNLFGTVRSSGLLSPRGPGRRGLRSRLF